MPFSTVHGTTVLVLLAVSLMCSVILIPRTVKLKRILLDHFRDLFIIIALGSFSIRLVLTYV